MQAALVSDTPRFRALKGSKANVKCLVVGNPANTNAAILANASGIPKKNITCLTRLDHNRARSMIAIKAGVAVDAVEVSAAACVSICAVLYALRRLRAPAGCDHLGQPFVDAVPLHDGYMTVT